MFVCPRFREIRDEMLANGAGIFGPDNIIVRMCQDESVWIAVAITQIMSSLQRKWPDDQKGKE